MDIPCGELDDWKNVANHPIPQSIKDKLKSINSNTNWYQDEFRPSFRFKHQYGSISHKNNKYAN